MNLTRNIKPAFHKLGLWGGMAYTGLFYVLGRGKQFKYSIVEIRNDQFIREGTMDIES